MEDTKVFTSNEDLKRVLDFWKENTECSCSLI